MVRSITTNKNVSFVPFHWAHPYAMHLREFDRKIFSELPNFKEYLQSYEASGHAVTAICNGQMVCCFGVNEFWAGVAEAWMLTSSHCDVVPVSLSRGAMRYFNQIAITLKLRRLQITVDERNIVAIRWARMLKFSREGVLRKYGPSGVDYLMMSRIFE